MINVKTCLIANEVPLFVLIIGNGVAIMEATSPREGRTDGVVRMPYRIVNTSLSASDDHKLPASYTRARGHEIGRLID
jgi:hypothetical protein